MKKIIVIAIITLIICVGFQSAFAYESKSTLDTIKDKDGLLLMPHRWRIIYIDDNNTEGPWKAIFYPYQYIQDGVDNATDGDTVYVFSGTYYERVVVTKPIRLVGEDKETTVIHGGQYIRRECIRIGGSNVIVEGFTCRSAWRANIYLCSYSHNNIIRNNILHDSEYHGISLSDSDNNIIEGNRITNSYNGIYLYSGSSRNIIKNNLIKNNRQGIWLYLGPARNQVIQNNFVTNKDVHATFDECPLFAKTRWYNNYWDDLGDREWYPIIGTDYWGEEEEIQYDRFPAKEPHASTQAYNIPKNLEDCDCQEVDRPNPNNVKHLMIRLKTVTNIFVSRYGHIPEVKEKCQELSNDINSVGIKDWFCDNLERVYNSTVNLFLYLNQKLKDEPRYIDGFLFLCTLYMIFFLNDIGVIFCDWI
jgi:parallel beta-helix repeat protein